jgi:hypothetical protein
MWGILELNQQDTRSETPVKKHIVERTGEQREALSHMISTGQAAARELTHARMLLKADQGPYGSNWSDAKRSEALEVSPGTVARVRKRCAERGVQEAILPAKASARRQRRLDGHQEAYLIALACRAPPDGGVRWTLRMLADQLVELSSVETVSHETVRQVLLANELQSWIKKPWCIPTQPDAEFVSHREDMLSVYMRPYDPRYAHVCMDEMNTQLLAETRDPLLMEPGKPKREDYEYERQGVWNISLACEPLAGQRYTMVAARRTTQVWAEFLCRLSDEYYPQAENIILVMDNLKRHVGLLSALRCIPLPSMRVGSTGPRLNSRPWIGNVCRNAWLP